VDRVRQLHPSLDLNSKVSSQVGDLDIIEIDLRSGNLVNMWIEYGGSTQVFNISVSYSNLKPKEPLCHTAILWRRKGVKVRL